jgi:hypothetical protein
MDRGGHSSRKNIAFDHGLKALIQLYFVTFLVSLHEKKKDNYIHVDQSPKADFSVDTSKLSQLFTTLQFYNNLETIELNGAHRKKILELFQLSLSWHYKKFNEIKSLPILQAVLH